MGLRASAFSFEATAELLADAGVPLAAHRLADDVDGAVRMSAELRPPLVLKAAGLLHKSDRGGVVLDLGGPHDVAVAADHLARRIGADAWPMVVQEQHTGHELLVGGRRSPGLGATVLVGAGGVYTELWQDHTVALAPVSSDVAEAMLRRLRTYPILVGYRGSATLDVAAVAELVVRVSRLVAGRLDLIELDLNPVLVKAAGEGVIVVDARVIVDAAEPPAERPQRQSGALDRLFEPDHIVVVGVSDDPAKSGSRVFANLRAQGYPGRLDAVHPTGGHIAGSTRYRSLEEIPGRPDLVSIAVPAHAVADITAAAAARQVGAVIVHSSGFAEGDDFGRSRQLSLAEELRTAGVPLLGPNSMGVLSPWTQVAASLSGGLRDPMVAGCVAVVTSSGALGSCLASRLMSSGVGLSRWVHLGNEADVDLAEVLEWLAGDSTTKTVVLLVEGMRDGARIVRAGRALSSRGVPVFAYLLATSIQGRAAAISHTGALIGRTEVRDAVLSSAGIVKVPSLRTLEDATALAACIGVPSGPRLGALTASGGACTVIADCADANGIALPALAEGTLDKLRTVVPAFAQVRNPVDLTAEVLRDPARFGLALDALLDADELDLVLVQLTTNADPGAESIAKAVLERRQTSAKPIVISRYGAERSAPRAMALYREAGVPVLDAPDRAMDAVTALLRVRSVMP